MTLRNILSAEGFNRTSAKSVLEATGIVENAGGVIDFMNAGTWGVFKNTRSRDKAFDELSMKGWTNILKEGPKNIRFVDAGKSASQVEAAIANPSAPFNRLLMHIVAPLKGRMTTYLGKGEFSGTFGLQVSVNFPEAMAELDDDSAQEMTESIRSELANFFGVDVDTEGVGDTNVSYTVRIRKFGVI